MTLTSSISGCTECQVGGPKALRAYDQAFVLRREELEAQRAQLETASARASASRISRSLARRSAASSTSASGRAAWSAPSELPTSRVATGVGEVGLQAQLDKARQELADCVGCASARTPQGQEAIHRASDKVARLEARLERTRQDEQAALPPGRVRSTGMHLGRNPPEASTSTPDHFAGMLAIVASAFFPDSSLSCPEVARRPHVERNKSCVF